MILRAIAYVIVAAFLLIAGAGQCQAQHWWATPNTLPLTNFDTAILPHAVTFQWQAESGWSVPSGTTWVPIWPRNAQGAWYRSVTYSQPEIWRQPVFSFAYRCYMSGPTAFRCRDIARQIDRYIGCPATIAIGPMVLWRSEYHSAWPERGLFTANVGPWGATTGRTLPLTGAVVTSSGQRINCLYGNITSVGPGTTTDIWTFRW